MKHYQWILQGDDLDERQFFIGSPELMILDSHLDYLENGYITPQTIFTSCYDSIAFHTKDERFMEDISKAFWAAQSVLEDYKYIRYMAPNPETLELPCENEFLIFPASFSHEFIREDFCIKSIQSTGSILTVNHTLFFIGDSSMDTDIFFNRLKERASQQ